LIPNIDESFDDLSDEGKKMSKIVKLKEVAYIELILSIYLKLAAEKFH
jgi:hypothetical protein